MVYSVDWPNRTVTIPKSDLAVLSASPEIYALDMLAFWAAIHAIQDGPGMTFPAIMRSNAPVTISGTTYVRSIEIINDYKIAFEAGTYQVNLTGANNNLLDARVANSVSINPSNSAGAVIVDSGKGGGVSQEGPGEVWDALLADHGLAGSTGQTLAELLAKLNQTLATVHNVNANNA